jgi:hypothetical protein
MFSYHVTFGIDKKVISVSSKERRSIIGALQPDFEISGDNLLIQTWDVDFSHWINVSDTTVLPDKGKLQIILKAGQDSDVRTPSVSVTSSNTPCSAVLPDRHNPPVETPSSSRWPDVYSLPTFPKQLQDDLHKAASLVSVDSSVLHQVIRVLYEDIVQYTIYPTSQQYQEVCQCIIRMFPQLRDRAVFNGKSSCQPYKTWHAMLATKFKSERGKMSKHPHVQAARCKYSVMRKLIPVVVDTSASDKQAKRCSRPQPEVVTVECDGEDATSIAGHVKTMQEEMKRSVPNNNILEDRMARTMSARRADISSKVVADILNLYPALKLDVQIQKEIQRMTGNDVANQLRKFFTPARVDKFFELLQQQAKNSIASTLLSAVGKSSDNDMSAQKLGCVLLLLPHVFKEPLSSWFIVTKEPDILMPLLFIELVSENEDIFRLDYVKLATFLDKKPVTAPTDYLAAITTLLSMYWVFDVEFPKCLKKTITFLAGHVCQLVRFKVTPPLLKVTNFVHS